MILSCQSNKFVWYGNAIPFPVILLGKAGLSSAYPLPDDDSVGKTYLTRVRKCVETDKYSRIVASTDYLSNSHLRRAGSPSPSGERSILGVAAVTVAPVRAPAQRWPLTRRRAPAHRSRQPDQLSSPATHSQKRFIHHRTRNINILHFSKR